MASLDLKGKTKYILYRRNGKQFRKNIGRITNTEAKKILIEFERKLSYDRMGIKLPERVTLDAFFKEYMSYVNVNQSAQTLRSKTESLKNFRLFISITDKRDLSRIFFDEISYNTLQKYISYRKNYGGRLLQSSFSDIEEQYALSSKKIWYNLHHAGYITKNGQLTSKFNPYSSRTLLADLNENHISHKKEIYDSITKTLGVTARTINIELDFFSSCLQFAEKMNYQFTPVKIKELKLKEPKKKKRSLTKSEIQQILHESSDYMKQVIIIGLTTGFRISAILNIKWEDVDFENNLIASRMSEDFNPKNQQEHVIPIRPELREYLLWLKNNYIDPVSDEITPREGWQSTYLICRPDGTRIKSVTKAFGKLMKRLGISDATPHILRHSCGTFLYMDTSDIYYVKQFLGHKDVTTTAKIYTHPTWEFISSETDRASTIADILKTLG